MSSLFQLARALRPSSQRSLAEVCCRGLATSSAAPLAAAAAAAAAAELPSPYPRGFLEVREYTLKPESAAAYVKLACVYGDARKALLPLVG